jgi:hypothetical protein
MARGRVAKPAASRSTSRNASSNAAKASDAAKADESALLDLGPLEEGVLVCRPSSRNRSPYVGDVRLVSGPNEGTTCVTHLPNLDSGGKCRPGVRLLCRRQPGVGPDTVGKFGTPKCELVCQLLRCEEPENAPGGVWVSAHPAIGEKLTQALMQRGAFDDRLFMRVGKSPAKKKEDVVDDGSPFDQPPVSVSPVSSQVCRRREVSESASGSFRPDFSVEHPDGSVTVVETKQVVDTDYDAATAARAAALQPGHPVYAMRNSTHVTSDEALAKERTNEGTHRDSKDSKTKTASDKKMAPAPYVRSGIFPWGRRGQKGPDGEPVVSARAIDHLRELSAIARGDVGNARSSSVSNLSSGLTTRAAVVLMAGRHDVYSIRANGAACPSFAKHAGLAAASGVAILGHKVRWGEGPDSGKAFDAGPVPIEAPLSEGDEVLVPKPTKRTAPAAKEAPARSDGGDDEKASAAGKRNTGSPAKPKRRRRGTEAREPA